jgi:microcystin-dependent protein
MPPTVISGKQLKDSTIQRVDLDTSTVGQAVVAKLVQGTGITLSSTGADSGTGDVTVNAGPGVNAFTITSAPFTVPAVGSTVNVTVNDATFVVVGQMLAVQNAGGTTAGSFLVQAKSGNQLTLLNPSTATAPLADANQSGLLKQLSGNATDYVGGDNNCHALASVPTGAMIDFAGSAAPSGWLLCDGSAQSRTTFSALFNVIGSTYGAGDGSTTFNLPDLRSRIAVGAGQGTGLANRVLAATGGEETHQLTIAELASHTHIQNAHTHAYTSTNRAGVGLASGSYTMAFGDTTGATTAVNQNTGGDGAHNNMPPFLVLNKIIKT